MITETCKIVKSVAKTVKNTTIFNDKLVDGTRSVKVWGFGAAEYKRCQTLLEAAGFKVKLIEREEKSHWDDRMIMFRRLHVTE